MIHTALLSAPDDYLPLVDESVLFAAGVTEQCADLSINDDVEFEPTETFLVSVSSAPGETGVVIGSPSPTVVSIIDNDTR